MTFAGNFSALLPEILQQISRCASNEAAGRLLQTNQKCHTICKPTIEDRQPAWETQKMDEFVSELEGIFRTADREMIGFKKTARSRYKYVG